MTKYKLLAGLLGTAVLVSPLAAHAEDEAAPQYTVLDGKYLDDRVYMPLRAAADGIGAVTTWNQKTKTATVELNGKRFEATVGPYVKLFDNRIYVQFRQFDSTFFDPNHIIWQREHLQASSDRFIIQVAPLKDAEAVKFATNAIAKKPQRKQFLKDTDGFFAQEYVYWEGFDKYKVIYNSEWNADGEYYSSTIEAKMKKSNHQWVIYSFNYGVNGMLPPH
ncbi:stalk domain-containing protein [Cohnella lubricantis]|nr:stalk domain-containing protein [Cohnella lubricantis]MBP2118132.1 hypothetical protein [Cohnella lubricantis]